MSELMAWVGRMEAAAYVRKASERGGDKYPELIFLLSTLKGLIERDRGERERAAQLYGPGILDPEATTYRLPLDLEIERLADLPLFQALPQLRDWIEQIEARNPILQHTLSRVAHHDLREVEEQADEKAFSTIVTAAVGLETKLNDLSMFLYSSSFAHWLTTELFMARRRALPLAWAAEFAATIGDIKPGERAVDPICSANAPFLLALARHARSRHKVADSAMDLTLIANFETMSPAYVAKTLFFVWERLQDTLVWNISAPPNPYALGSYEKYPPDIIVADLERSLLRRPMHEQNPGMTILKECSKRVTAGRSRAYLLVPPGMLFWSGEHRKWREEIVEAGILEGVVSLPARTGPGSSLLVLRSPAGESRGSIKMAIADPTVRTTKYSKLWIEGNETDGLVRLVPIEGVREKGYDLSVPRYLEPKAELIRAQSSELIQKERELAEIRKRMDSLMASLRARL